MPTGGGRLLALLLFAAALFGPSGAVPSAKKRLANSSDTLSAAGTGYPAGLLDLTNSSLWEYDDLATAHIHYAAGVLGNSTKKRMDYVLPKLSVAAKHYGWVNKSTPLPTNAEELAQYGKEAARPYLKSYLRNANLLSVVGKGKGTSKGFAKGDAETSSDEWEDQMLDKAGEMFWSVWLPSLVKVWLVLGVCCLCGGVLYWLRQQPKAHHS